MHGLFVKNGPLVLCIQNFPDGSVCKKVTTIRTFMQLSENDSYLLKSLTTTQHFLPKMTFHHGKSYNFLRQYVLIHTTILGKVHVRR